METKGDLDRGLALNNTELKGKALRIDMAKQKPVPGQATPSREGGRQSFGSMFLS